MKVLVLHFVLVALQFVLILGSGVVLPVTTVPTPSTSASIVTGALSIVIPSSGNSVTVEWSVQVIGAPMVLWQFCPGNNWLCEGETKEAPPFLYQMCFANGNVTVGDLPTGTSA